MRGKLMLAVAVLITHSAAGRSADAKAREYKDASGFTLKYPEGWLLTLDPPTQSDHKLYPAEFGEALRKFGLETNPVRVLLTRESQHAGIERLAVLVSPEAAPVTPEALELELDDLRGRTRPGIVSVEEVRGEVRTINGREALDIGFVVRSARKPSSAITCRYVRFANEGRSYELVALSWPESYAKFAPSFAWMIDHFQPPAAPAAPAIGTFWLAAIGCVVGGLIGLAVVLVRSRGKGSLDRRAVRFG